MCESISKNNELENEMTLDMSYFWYSDDSLCQRNIARWAMQEISVLQTWWNGTGSSGTGYCHQAQWVVKDLIENPPCLSLIQVETTSIECAM